ncbi:MAG: GNAT family N-acetyltransferase [Actinomycetota bacterium]
MAGIVVRRAERGDVEQLTRLMLLYIVDFYRHPEPPPERLRTLIDVLFEGTEGLQLVAEEDGNLVGFATLYFTWSTLNAARIAVMNDLYVMEAARGTGIARPLFEACRAEARDRGCAEMTWETAADNHRAQRFYEKMGGRRGSWVTYSI